MAYVVYGYYKNLNPGSDIEEAEFDRLLRKAEREVDKATTGIDNVKKLRVAFPENEFDSETVKVCVCGLIELLHDIESAEKFSSSMSGFIERPDGTIQGKVVTSVSAGNESISFSTVGASGGSIVGNAAKGIKEKEVTIKEFIRGCLSGVLDSNGVNLLYAGRYPYVIKK